MEADGGEPRSEPAHAGDKASLSPQHSVPADDRGPKPYTIICLLIPGIEGVTGSLRPLPLM